MQPKMLRRLFLLLLCVASAFQFSCNGDDKDEAMTDPTCVKLTRDQIQNWIDKGYIDPGVKGTVIRFRTVLSWPKTVFRIYAGVQKLDDGSLIPESEIELSATDDSCGAISLDDFTMS